MPYKRYLSACEPVDYLRKHTLLPAPDYRAVILRIVESLDVGSVRVVGCICDDHADICEQSLRIRLQSFNCGPDDGARNVSAILQDKAQIRIENFDGCVIAVV